MAKSKEQIDIICGEMFNTLDEYYTNVEIYSAANNAAAEVVAIVAAAGAEAIVAAGNQSMAAAARAKAQAFTDIASANPSDAAVAAAASAATAVALSTTDAAYAIPFETSIPEAVAIVTAAAVAAAAIDESNFKLALERVLAQIEEEDKALLGKRLKLFLHPDRLDQQEGAFAAYVRSTASTDKPFKPFLIMNSYLAVSGFGERDAGIEAPLLSPEEMALQHSLYRIYVKLNNILLDNQRYTSMFSFPLVVLRYVVNTTALIMTGLALLPRIPMFVIQLVKGLTESLLNVLTNEILYRDLGLFALQRQRDRDVFDDFINEGRWNLVGNSLLSEMDNRLLLASFGEGPEYIQGIDAACPGSSVMGLALKSFQGPKYWMELYKAIYAAANLPVAPEENYFISSVMRAGKIALALILTTAILIPSELLLRFANAVLANIVMPIIVLTKVALTAVLNTPLYVEDLFLAVENYLFNTQSDPNETPLQNEFSPRLALEYANPTEEVNVRSQPGSGLGFFVPSVQQGPRLPEDEPLLQNRP